jgi:type III pantothenate kinase
MFIAVDIGNTSIKLGCFSETTDWPRAERILSVSTLDPTSWEKLDSLPAESAKWFVGSVQRDAETQLSKWVAHHRPGDRYRKLNNADLPIKNEVEFPDRVGIDRLLAAIAANTLRESGRPAIVIDAGTAVTVDLVSAEGAFAGGIIWPGWRMMAQSLAGNTDALPLVNAAIANEPPAIVGTSTEKAIRSALYWGNVGAVREFIARMRASLATEPQVFVTGGDAARLVEHATDRAQCVNDLVLAGIVLTARALA